MRHLKNIGDHGEKFAAGMLEEAGYEIIERNYRCRYGEVDIIALRNGVIHFVEVKTRTGMDYGYPSDAVTDAKMDRLRKSAEHYLIRRTLPWRDVSIDVYEIMTNMITGC